MSRPSSIQRHAQPGPAAGSPDAAQGARTRVRYKTQRQAFDARRRRMRRAFVTALILGCGLLSYLLSQAA